MKIENNFTKVPNDLLEAVIKYDSSKTNKEIILAVIRLTYGYHREFFPISLSLLAHLLQKDRANISRNLNRLITMNVILVHNRHENNKAKVISINTNYNEWYGFPEVLLDDGENETGVNLTTSEDTAVVNSTTLNNHIAVVKDTTVVKDTVVNSTTPLLSDVQHQMLSNLQPTKETTKQTLNKQLLQKEKQEKEKVVVVVTEKENFVVSEKPKIDCAVDEFLGLLSQGLGRKCGVIETNVVNDLYGEYGYDELKYAFNQAAMSNNFKLNYIKGILRKRKEQHSAKREIAKAHQQKIETAQAVNDAECWNPSLDPEFLSLIDKYSVKSICEDQGTVERYRLLNGVA